MNLFHLIPEEMRLYRNWVMWRYEDTDSKKPTKVPYTAQTGKPASVTNPDTWTSYDHAIEVFKMGWYSGIGFVLTEADPFAFIDLDDTKGDQVSLDRQMTIFKEFDSYAEKSPSGTGLHIILKGSIPSGRRRSSIEIYSNQRFMTMTGDVYREGPINEHNELLNALYGQMGQGNKAVQHYAGLAEAKETDEAVIDQASRAANGEKFLELLAGNWQGMYQSQSEADFALVDIIAFFTHNRAQIARIFQRSGLGQREKAKRNDYVNYMLNKCFDRMLPPVDIDGLRNKLDEVIAERAKQPVAEAPPETSFQHIVPASDVPHIEQPAESPYSVPPGLVGEIAQFIYAQAPRPVAELALAGAIGLVAGIVGRAYNISGTGLNQYILTLAATGSGKEAIAKGIDRLMGHVVKTVPAAMEFVGPGEIASAQAMHKYLSKSSRSFVSVVGEFGIYLQQMASTNAPPHLVGLRRMMLDLFNKSGEGQVVGKSVYSDRDKNSDSISAPAFTMLGESTPEKFYEGLHEGMISEGLLPRFTIIEYHGKRPPLNYSHTLAKPSFELCEKLAGACANALMLNSQNKVVNVQMNEDADDTFRRFNEYCDLAINSSDREVRRHLWNRAHIKAMKLAAVVAVGCNPYTPSITNEVANWAINIVIADANNLLGRFEAGDIGVDNEENKQLMKVADALKDFIVKPWQDCAKYAGDTASNLHSAKIIPYSFVQRKLAAVAVFRKDKMGSSFAIKRALKTLCERGDIQEVGRPTLAKDYGTSAVCYMVANPKAIGL